MDSSQPKHVDFRNSALDQGDEAVAVVPASVDQAAAPVVSKPVSEVQATALPEQSTDVLVGAQEVQQGVPSIATAPSETVPPTVEVSANHPVVAEAEPLPADATQSPPTVDVQPALDASPPAAQPVEAAIPENASVAQPPVQEQSLNQLESWFGDASEKNGSLRIDSAEPTTK